jgi:hypothetical protein
MEVFHLPEAQSFNIMIISFSCPVYKDKLTPKERK